MADSPATPEFPLHVLSEYALLADGERGILVGPRGDFVWMCAPRWDSEAVFSTLIGGAGVYAVTPVGAAVRVGWLLRAGQPDLAQPVGHHHAGHRVPGGAGHAGRPAHGRGCCAGSRPSTATPGSGSCFDPRAGFGRHQPSQAAPPTPAACGPPAAGRSYLRWSGMKARGTRADGSLRADGHWSRPVTITTWCWRSPTAPWPGRHPIPPRPGAPPVRPGTPACPPWRARSPTGTPARPTPCCAG